MQDVKTTDGGRTVYGGGGISPDEKYTPPRYDALKIQLLTKFAFFDFSKRYFGAHGYKLPADWTPSEDILTEFHDFLLKEKFQFTEAAFTLDHDWIKWTLRKEMYIAAFGPDESRRIAVENDPTVQKAMESMPKARALLMSANRVIVQRLSK